MASTLVQFRTEDTEKLKSIQILEKLGLSLPAYLRMCMSRLNQENGIPFSMKLEEEKSPGIRAMKRASKIAAPIDTTQSLTSAPTEFFSFMMAPFYLLFAELSSREGISSSEGDDSG